MILHSKTHSNESRSLSDGSQFDADDGVLGVLGDVDNLRGNEPDRGRLHDRVTFFYKW